MYKLEVSVMHKGRLAGEPVHLFLHLKNLKQVYTQIPFPFPPTSLVTQHHILVINSINYHYAIDD